MLLLGYDLEQLSSLGLGWLKSPSELLLLRGMRCMAAYPNNMYAHHE